MLISKREMINKIDLNYTNSIRKKRDIAISIEYKTIK